MPLLRGVKQGDPILFNVVLDYLVRELEVAGLGGARVPVLAFADDLVLVGESRTELQGALDITLEFLGMGLSLGKCCNFFVRRKETTWVQELCGVRVGEEALRELAWDKQFRYLKGGVHGP